MNYIAPRCANHAPGKNCPNKATHGHIFCNGCRIATGGYNYHPLDGFNPKQEPVNG